MQTIMTGTTTVYADLDRVTALVAQIQADDPDFAYAVEPRKAGGWVVVVRDETGAFLGTL